MIEFHLNKFDKRLDFQIIKQENIHTETPGKSRVYSYECDDYKFFVYMSSRPELRIMDEDGDRKYNGCGRVFIKIFLRGSSVDKDFSICSYVFRDNEDRDLIYNYILDGFKNFTRDKKLSKIKR